MYQFKTNHHLCNNCFGDFMHALANNIRRLRYNYELTQKDLAKKIDTTQQTISEIERGAKLPDVALLCRISDFFNVSIDDILYNSKVIPNSKQIKITQKVSSELLFLLKDNKDEIDLIVDFLLYKKKKENKV